MWETGAPFLVFAIMVRWSTKNIPVVIPVIRPNWCPCTFKYRLKLISALQISIFCIWFRAWYFVSSLICIHEWCSAEYLGCSKFETVHDSRLFQHIGHMWYLEKWQKPFHSNSVAASHPTTCMNNHKLYNIACVWLARSTYSNNVCTCDPPYWIFFAFILIHNLQFSSICWIVMSTPNNQSSLLNSPHVHNTLREMLPFAAPITRS